MKDLTLSHPHPPQTYGNLVPKVLTCNRHGKGHLLDPSRRDRGRTRHGIHREPGHPTCRVWESISLSHRVHLVSSNIPILTAFRETLVQVGTNNTLIELGTADILHAVERILVVIVFDEAEAARSLLVPVESHDETLYFAAPICSCQS